MSFCESFAPAIDTKSKILILGSMPGIQSLNQQQYYAHPQNRFWRVITAVCQEDAVPENYEDKLTMLLQHQFALWDVIQSCEREGSLDSAILQEIPNDFTSLLEAYPQIKTICFNGGKAFSSYKKHFKMMQSDRINYITLPSTSPANARWTLPKLISHWQHTIYS
ncbi:DNA-deoxyinosine glycosylase [Anaerosinus massiliensis]|uniref:DNA-deoxyinosine glycosylase n=1 Tax=Massilibacillus massiliensis TaxID=1806837 RepID=UPI000AD4F281|nr:DNA-deoxyinosine glycosylase [Massilibacillus massiliensis]